MAYAVVMPNSGREISEILQLANEKMVPVFVRGSGTQLAGSTRPHVPGIILNTHRMNRIEIFPKKMVISNADLDASVRMFRKNLVGMVTFSPWLRGVG